MWNSYRWKNMMKFIYWKVNKKKCTHMKTIHVHRLTTPFGKFNKFDTLISLKRPFNRRLFFVWKYQKCFDISNDVIKPSTCWIVIWIDRWVSGECPVYFKQLTLLVKRSSDCQFIIMYGNIADLSVQFESSKLIKKNKANFKSLLI